MWSSWKINFSNCGRLLNTMRWSTNWCPKYTEFMEGGLLQPTEWQWKYNTRQYWARFPNRGWWNKCFIARLKNEKAAGRWIINRAISIRRWRADKLQVLASLKNVVGWKHAKRLVFNWNWIRVPRWSGLYNRTTQSFIRPRTVSIT